jgi:hypothetical protein
LDRQEQREPDFPLQRTNMEGMKPVRPSWLTFLPFALPHALGLFLLVAAILWGLGQTRYYEVKVVAGALAVWVGENATLITYWGIRYSALRDPDRFGAESEAMAMKHRTPLMVALSAGPGLWIGLVSTNPVAAVIGTRVAIVLIVLLNRLRLAQLERLAQMEREPFVVTAAVFTRFVVDVTLTCGWALIGSLLRLSGW